jgi:hypothetical protein
MTLKPHVRAAAAAVATASAPASASIDVGVIRDRFNFDWAMADPPPVDGVDTWWWWARSVRVDPNEVIADDGEGSLWSIPFSTDGADAVTFGEPIRVRETFVPVAAADGAAATEVVRRRRQRVLAAQLDQPTKQDRNPAAASAGPDNEVTAMDESVRQALARQHGLDPATATEDEVNAAVLAAETPPEGDPPETPPETPPEGDPTPETPPAEPAPAAASDRVVTVDRDQWERVQSEVQASAADRRARETASLDAEADAAVTDGRITPASRAAWRAAIDPGENPDAAATARAQSERQALAGLAKGRVPVTAPVGSAATADSGLMTTGWFPQLTEKEA